MCLAVPAKVISINGHLAKVDLEGNTREVGIRVVPDVKVGDWVLVHAGFALEIVDAKEAEETLVLLRQMAETAEDDDPEVGEAGCS